MDSAGSYPRNCRWFPRKCFRRQRTVILGIIVVCLLIFEVALIFLSFDLTLGIRTQSSHPLQSNSVSATKSGIIKNFLKRNPESDKLNKHNLSVSQAGSKEISYSLDGVELEQHVSHLDVKKKSEILPFKHDCLLSASPSLLTVIVLSRPDQDTERDRMRKEYKNFGDNMISLEFVEYADNCVDLKSAQCILKLLQPVHKRTCYEFLLVVSNHPFINYDLLMRYLFSLSSEKDFLILPPRIQESKPMFVLSGGLARTILNDADWTKGNFGMNSMVQSWDTSYRCSSPLAKCTILHDPRFCLGDKEFDLNLFCDGISPNNFLLHGFSESSKLLETRSEIKWLQNQQSLTPFTEEAYGTVLTIAVVPSTKLSDVTSLPVLLYVRKTFPNVKIIVADQSSHGDETLGTSFLDKHDEVIFFDESATISQIETEVLAVTTTSFLLLIPNHIRFFHLSTLKALLDELLDPNVCAAMIQAPESPSNMEEHKCSKQEWSSGEFSIVKAQYLRDISQKTPGLVSIDGIIRMAGGEVKNCPPVSLD